MFCYNCHKEIQDDAVFCPFCGAQVGVAINVDNDPAPAEEPSVQETATIIEPIAEPVIEPEPKPEPQPEPVSSANDEQPEDDRNTREVAPHTVSSFVWSLVANQCAIIPVLGFIFALTALIKSSKGRRIVKTNPEHYRLKGMLTAAFIISIIALVGSIIEPIAWFSLFKDIFDGSSPFSSPSFV